MKYDKKWVDKTLRQATLSISKHSVIEGSSCAKCGENRPIALYAIRCVHGLNVRSPEGFMRITSLDKTVINGAFPLCDRCAPPCKKCGLPVMTKSAISFFQLLVHSYSSDNYKISLNHGRCPHFHLWSFFR